MHSSHERLVQVNYSWLPAPLRRQLRRLLLAGLKVGDWCAGDSPGALLLLAHQRSGSTLLHHLLISHPQILGSGERLEQYASVHDLDRLRVDSHIRRRQFFRRPRYVTDQINHTQLLVSEELLNHPRVRAIILIREPQATMASISSVLGKRLMLSVHVAATYYCSRLSALARYARIIDDRSRALFLTYDNLTTDTASTLRKLQTFLGLHPNLSAQYRTFDFTGVAGDPSPHIHAGRILQGKPTHPLALDPALLTSLLEAYEDCQNTLREHCLS
jgi:sulfotransferase family protein